MQRIGVVSILFLFLALFSSCSDDNNFRIVISKNDPNYNQAADLIANALRRNGFEVEIGKAENTLEATALVASGQADLSFVMNTTRLGNRLGDDVSNIRTIAPIFNRILYVMHRLDSAPYRYKDLMTSGKVYAGTGTGERITNLKTYFQLARIVDYQITEKIEESDIQIFWGTVLASRVKELIPLGWKLYSMPPTTTEAYQLRMGKVRPFELPPFWQTGSVDYIHTLSTDVLMVTNRDNPVDQIFDLTEALFNERHRLSEVDVIYEYLNENFDRENLNYPIHKGAEAYFKRDQPSFLEKFSPVIALIFTAGFVLVAVFRSVSIYIERRRKDRIDHYFSEFMRIVRTKKSDDKKVEELEALLHRALESLMKEKLEVQDFDVLARLIYAEINRSTKSG